MRLWLAQCQLGHTSANPALAPGLSCCIGQAHPVSTLRRRPRERLRMTQGRCGSLLHIRMTLSFTTPRRFSRRTGELHMKKWYALAAVVLAAVGAKATTLFAAVSSTGRCPFCHH